MQRHPSEMTPNGLRCLRESLGLTVRALSHAIGQSYQPITQWEKGERPISTRNAAVFADLVEYTETCVEALAAEPPENGLVTYLRDEEFREHVDTGGWVLSAAWHRMVVWRAAERSGAEIQ